MNRSITRYYRKLPKRCDRATLTEEAPTTPRVGARQAHPQTHGHNPAYKRARARPISRARALPTNRHEGGSLT